VFNKDVKVPLQEAELVVPLLPTPIAVILLTLLKKYYLSRKSVNSLTAIRVPAGTENSHPMGFLR
jgi:hypothetical protein